MTTSSDGTAPASAVPLPEAPRLRRALESVGLTAHRQPGAPPNPLGPRGDAAQYAGILAAFIEQVETGLRGGELQAQFQKGWLTGYSRSTPAVLASIGEQLGDLARFASEGMGEVPLASRQLSTAALALLTAARAFTAAADIATGEEPALASAVKLSETMIANAHELARYIAKLEREDGPVSAEPDIRLDI
jgi:hypothetical protein